MKARAFGGGFLAALFFLGFALNFAFASENSVNLAENSRDFVNFSENSQPLVILSEAKNPQPLSSVINSNESPQNSVNSTQNSQTFILINEGILKPEAAARLDEIGTELKLKSGITLALGVSHQSLDELLNLVQSLNEPYLLFVMSLKDKKIKVQSVGVFAPNEAEKIAQKVLESSVYPLLGQKNPNYAAALFNGYADFADIIAANAKITLASSVGNANRQTMNIIKIVFYGVICVALLYFFSRRTKRKRV